MKKLLIFVLVVVFLSSCSIKDYIHIMHNNESVEVGIPADPGPDPLDPNP